MRFWIPLFISIGLLATSTTANPVAGLSKREEGRRCESKHQCVTWYTTGYPSCSSGYEATHYEAKNSPLGTYCERKCTDNEWQQCASKDCKFYTSECRLYPGNHICAKALNFCGGPLSVPERSCTKEAMDQDVKWDTKTKTCDVDPSPGPGAERHLVLNLYTKGGKINQDSFPTDAKRLRLDCGPTTEKGAEAIWEKIRDGLKAKTISELKIKYCKGKADYSKPKPTWNCAADESKWDQIKPVFQRACEAGSPVNGLKPTYTSSA